MRKKPGLRIIIILAAGLVLVGAARGGQLRGVQSGVGRITDPIGSFFWQAGSGTANFIRLIPQVKDLAVQNSQLAHEVADLKERLAQDSELRAQNEALRNQLSFGEVEGRRLVPAEIIAYQPDNFRAYITINRGHHDGLSEGMAVISEGSLVGKLSDVSEVSSKVFLAVDPDFRVAALDQTADSRATGTVRGQVGRGLVMEKIPQDQAVNVGDTIITSGLGGGLPKGFVIGRIQSINQKDDAVFQSAQVVSPVNFTQLELVFVVAS